MLLVVFRMRVKGGMKVGVVVVREVEVEQILWVVLEFSSNIVWSYG